MPSSLIDMETAAFWIEQLSLKAHPEGGFYSETYRSDETIPQEALPSRYASAHSFSTAIYFLLRSQDISAFHRITSDELWFFHTGSPVQVHFLGQEGIQSFVLGPNVQKGQRFQLLVPKGTWFGAEVLEKESYTLVSCTVAPGFAFEDFELASRHDLLVKFPSNKDIIERLTQDR